MLLILNPIGGQACPTGGSQSLDYIRRDNNRCEGRKDRNASSGIFNLISFSTSNLSDYSATMDIRVPGTGTDRPTIQVQSLLKSYLLDELETKQESSGFIFHLNTALVQRLRVPFKSLRSIAYITRDSSPTYFPVILGQPSGRYEFVVYTPERRTFPNFWNSS